MKSVTVKWQYRLLVLDQVRLLVDAHRDRNIILNLTVDDVVLLQVSVVVWYGVGHRNVG
jgi:hypothetical protein